MKTSTKLAYASILVSMMSGTMTAKDLYISANGDDSNSGIAADAPRATLTSLNDIIEQGDVIHVSGIIDLTAEKALTDGVTDKAQTWGHWFTSADGKQTGFYINGSNSPADSPWKNITIEGEDPATDGFDGKEATRLFYVRGDNNNTTVTFRNLSLINGLAPAEGAGAIFIHDNGFVNIENCLLENNHLDFTVLSEEEHSSGNIVLKKPNSERAGAVLIQTGKLNISDSQFIGNKNRRGGAICVNGGEINVARTLFEGNGADIDGKYLDNTRGGAVILWPLNINIKATFDHCDFINNTVWNMAGALYLYSNTDGCSLIDALFTNCSFIQNSAIDGQAGAVMINNAENYGAKDDKLKNIYATFANSSFFFNESKSEGGAIYMNGGLTNDEFRMINCTVAKNSTKGNAGHGAGYVENIANSTYSPQDANRYFYNCVFEQNECPAASEGKGEYSDFIMYGYFDIDHSYFGRLMFTRIAETDFNDMVALSGRDAETIWHAKQAGNFGDESHEFILSETAINNYDYSGGKFKFITLDEGCQYIGQGNTEHLTLAPRTVTAANGKEFTIQGYDITESDQMGFAREAGKCTIGAMEATTEETERYFEDIEFPYLDPNGGSGEEPDEPKDPETGIDAIAAGSVTYANGIVTAEGSHIAVYNIAGALVASGNNTLDLNNLAKGAYIIAAGESTLKVIK